MTIANCAAIFLWPSFVCVLLEMYLQQQRPLNKAINPKYTINTQIKLVLLHFYG